MYLQRILMLGVAAAVTALVGGSLAQATRTTLDLSTGPLINSNDVSNLALVLSVEFPTVRSAYKRDSGYEAAKKYIGYHDSNTCYRYVGTSLDGYFAPNGATNTSYHCNVTGAGSGWSGNFLNYANTSSADIMRLALTGGDRYVDEAGTGQRTILQRAILPSDASGSGGNRNTNFYAGGTNYSTSGKNWDKIILSAGTLTAALTPFGPSTQVVVKSCDDKIFFGNTDTGQCAAPGNNANLAVTSMASASPTIAAGTVTGTFKARVLVCDDTEGPVRKDLCLLQPNGKYKPVGEIQKNSDKVRVAAFGYLIDSATWGGSSEGSQYGGVLRAPMKFVGPKQKSVAGIVSDNSEKEWDVNTGVFVAKPINTSNETGYTLSGVINYVNRFGRHARSDGVGVDVYKRRDPVGELYYEAIRYYQAQQPTSTAVSSTTTALMAGYPIYSTWTDPMQNACQRNYAMLIGDDNTSKDANIPGSTISSQTRSNDTITRTAPDGTSKSVTLNADAWAKVLSSFETNGSVTYTDAQGVTRTANGNSGSTETGVQSANSTLASTTFADAASYLYAGVAYWANTQSIRPDKPLARVRTFVIDVDEGGNGNINSSVSPTSTRSRKPRNSGFYLAGKYGGFADIGPDGSTTTGEGNPFKTYLGGTLTTSHNEWLSPDSATSPSPSGYFLASEPTRLINAIKTIFAEAAKPAGNLAGGSINISRINSATLNGAIYQPKINIGDFTGTVIRTELKFNTATQQVEIGTDPIWDAANILTGIQTSTSTLNPYPTPANRKIFSYSATNLSGVSFTWANIDAAVKTALKTHPSTSIDEGDTVGEARLNYVRGDRTNETDFRARKLIMGDVINSPATLKGAPDTNISDSGYSTFYSTYKNRTPTLYIGSNDGMLHAFRAADSKTESTNGQEIFAYVPRAVSTKLAKLTDKAYTKDAFVDGAIAVAEAFFYRPTESANAWGTVLAAGMGGGAQGLFALDVTNPESFGVNNVLWEFTEADDSDMGNLLAEPRIVKLAVNGVGASTPSYKWFVMVTSGFNNYKVDGNQSTTGKQALFLLSLEKQPGPSNPWVLGSNYYKIVVTDSGFSSTTEATGMGMPGVATAPTGHVLYAYAGDLQGNLWRFDLSTGSADWGVSSTKATAMFLARSTGGVKQPITVVPVVGYHPSVGYVVGFGTGKFIEPADGLASSAAYQSIYAVWDALDGKTVQRTSTGSGASLVNGLATRTLSVTVGTTTTSISTTGSSFTFGTASTARRGWVADFTGNMERISVDPVLGFGVFALNSTIPGGDPCTGNGNANQYGFNLFTGKSVKSTIPNNTVGYLGPPKLLPTGDPKYAGGTTVPNLNNSTRRTTTTDTLTRISSGTGGAATSTLDLGKVTVGRMSWREIVNFQ